LERNGTIAVHCKSGYRSSIASSLLQRAGYNVINVVGGLDAWEQAQLPTTVAAAVGA
jgi:hydroxyacylglutathione hydrolase